MLDNPAIDLLVADIGLPGVDGVRADPRDQTGPTFLSKPYDASAGPIPTVSPMRISETWSWLGNRQGSQVRKRVFQFSARGHLACQCRHLNYSQLAGLSPSADYGHAA